MTDTPANSNEVSTSSRCSFRFANDARCRMPALHHHDSDAANNPEFCAMHAKRAQNNQLDPPIVPGELTDDLENFDSPATINQFLSRLLVLYDQDRVSSRRAAVFTYLAGQLLRSVSAMREAQTHTAKHVRPKIIWTIPGPPREGGPPSDPSDDQSL